MMKREQPKAYHPADIEPKWYRFWLEQDHFHADATAPKTPFCIVLPPPNVSGSLNMGHARTVTIQDILVRWRRMQAYNALWLPGTDHAGIATQLIVEADLLRQDGKTRHDLGREEFIQRVRAWKDLHAGRITEQLKALGCSLDWKRERFTMDEGLSHAVREAFVRLHEEGLIYRGEAVVHWCVHCHTALSDLEVDAAPEPGSRWHITCRLAGGGEPFVISTRRPELLLVAGAVALDPGDPGAAALAGRRVILPPAGREVPLVVDDALAGSSTLVAPAHRSADLEAGRRLGLEPVPLFDLEGRVLATASAKHAGLELAAVRQAVLAELGAAGVPVVADAAPAAIGRCWQCHRPVEGMLSRQWFVRSAPLAAPVVAAIEARKTRFIPEAWTSVFLDWLRHAGDWCISRQLWWGHRIPAWTCAGCGELAVAREAPAQCVHCGGTALAQDDDVLDTWFSAALWPLSTLGWPDPTRDLRTFYPNSVLETGSDIIFLWVARMMMMGLHFTKKSPFRVVLLHGNVLDADGEKMAKATGNALDVLGVLQGATRDVLVDRARQDGAPEGALARISRERTGGMAAAGADALRFTLAALGPVHEPVQLSLDRIEENRQLVNKIWNAARFATMNLGGFDADRFADNLRDGPSGVALGLVDRWILSRLARVIRTVDDALETYRLADAARAIRAFILTDLCEWYIELAKPALHDGVGRDSGGETEASVRRRMTQGTLAHVLETAMRLLHPFMPFISEEVWQQIPMAAGAPGSIMITLYPAPDDRFLDDDAERQMALVMDTVAAIRALRTEARLPVGYRASALLRTPDVDRVEALKLLRPLVERAAQVSLELAAGDSDELRLC